MMILAFLAGFMACLFVVMIFNARNIAAARRRRKKDRQEHPKKKIQATKVIVFSVLVTYHLAFLVGVWVPAFHPAGVCGVRGRPGSGFLLLEIQSGKPFENQAGIAGYNGKFV